MGISIEQAPGSGGGFTAATQAEQEAGSSTTVATTPGRQHFHPSAAKWWAQIPTTGAAATVSYNITSVTDTGTGDMTVNIATDFSGANWAAFGSMTYLLGSSTAITDGSSRFTVFGTKAAGTQQFKTYNGGGAPADPAAPYNVGGFGDQA